MINLSPGERFTVHLLKVYRAVVSDGYKSTESGYYMTEQQARDAGSQIGYGGEPSHCWVLMREDGAFYPIDGNGAEEFTLDIERQWKEARSKLSDREADILGIKERR